MTENTRHDRRAATNMKAVDHTHPDTGRPFGEAVVYQRGPTVAADGGARGDGEADAEETDEDTEATDEMRMKDVDHEAPDKSDANRVFERGTEGRDDTE
jgi:hypothetical protein